MQCEGMDWIKVDQDRNAFEFWIWQWTFRVHKRHFLISCVTFNFTMNLLLGVILNSECVWSRGEYRQRTWAGNWHDSFTWSKNDSRKIHWMSDFTISNNYRAWTVLKGTSLTLVQMEANMILFFSRCLIITAPCIFCFV
jgi:hypothetical protein